MIDPDRLTGLPLIRWINLDRATQRREMMEAQLAAWGLRHERFVAVDGAAGLAGHLTAAPPAGHSDPYLGCMLSHLTLARNWLAETDEPVLLVMEDDCLLDGVEQWPFDWPWFWNNRPFNFDALQLAIINPNVMCFRLHRRHIFDWSSAAYMLTRPYVEKLMRLHQDGDRFRLDNLAHGRWGVEDMIYDSGVTYSMPLFSYRTEMASSLNPDHIDAYHRPSHQLYARFWAERAATIPDWGVMTRPFGAFDADTPGAGRWLALPREQRFLDERAAPPGAPAGPN